MTNRRRSLLTRIPARIVRLCLVLVPVFAAHAQPTNQEAYQVLALRCLASVPDTTQVIWLDAPAQMPYVRTALTEKWRQEDRVLYLADSSAHLPDPHPPRLEYTIEAAHVAYTRNGRKQLDRTLTLALRYTFTTAEGRLLREDGCHETFTDTIRRANLPSVESDAFPETQGDLPRGSWVRRYLEPAVLAATTAITVYLFFNLRNDKSNDGV